MCSNCFIRRRRREIRRTLRVRTKERPENIELPTSYMPMSMMLVLTTKKSNLFQGSYQ